MTLSSNDLNALIASDHNFAGCLRPRLGDHRAVADQYAACEAAGRGRSTSMRSVCFNLADWKAGIRAAFSSIMLMSARLWKKCWIGR